MYAYGHPHRDFIYCEFCGLDALRAEPDGSYEWRGWGCYHCANKVFWMQPAAELLPFKQDAATIVTRTYPRIQEERYLDYCTLCDKTRMSGYDWYICWVCSRRLANAIWDWLVADFPDEVPWRCFSSLRFPHWVY